MKRSREDVFAFMGRNRLVVSCRSAVCYQVFSRDTSPWQPRKQAQGKSAHRCVLTIDAAEDGHSYWDTSGSGSALNGVFVCFCHHHHLGALEAEITSQVWI